MDEVVVLVGCNGVGCIIIIESIMGLLFVRSGRIRFRDEEIIFLSPYWCVKCGIGYALENFGIFLELIVSENLMIVCWFAANIGCKVAVDGDGDTEAETFR